MDEDDISESMDDSTLQPQPSIPAEVVAAIGSAGSSSVVNAVLEKANLPAENVMDILLTAFPGGRALVKLVLALRTRAFLCLHNLIGSLSLEDLGGPDALFSVWSNLGLLCFKDQGANG